MGIFDSVKNSITGSDDSGDQFKDEKFDSSFSSGDSQNRKGNGNLEPETGPDAMQGNQRPQGPQNKQPVQGQGETVPGTDRQPRNEHQGMDNSSNPQAGRPEPGSSQPQVSENTRNKMQDAGFNFDQQNPGSQGRQDTDRHNGNQRNEGGRQREEPSLNSREDRTTPVSDRKDDIDEIKSQNEQIIELLKRISRSLQEQGGSEHNRSRRHGGRR